MAKRYMMLREGDNEYFVFECRGIKRKENKLEVVSLHQYLYEVLYIRFVERIRTLNVDNLSYKEVMNIKTKFKKLLNPMYLIETARASGYLVSQTSTLYLSEVKKLITMYHKAFFRGTYHLYDDQQQLLIRQGDEVKSYPFLPITFRTYEEKVKKVNERYEVWKEKVSFHFSEWELPDLLWIAAIYQEHRNTTYTLWIQKMFEDRIDYIHSYNVEKMIEILYLNLVLNNY